MNNKRDQYRPQLPSDKDYIQKVAFSIERKEPVEDIPFEILTNVLREFGVQENPYDLVRGNGFDAASITKIADEAYEKVNTSELLKQQEEKLYALWDYLTEGDPLEKSDMIFVFGGGGVTRPELAAKLYSEGWAPKILFTGHSASYMKDQHTSEAELFAEIAHKQGVPQEAMVLEKEAKNTPENAINSIRLLKERNESPGKIILIQIEYQMRRAYFTFKAVADWKPQLIRYPAPSAKYKREKFWTDKTAWLYVFLEFIKMYGARQMDHF